MPQNLREINMDKDFNLNDDYADDQLPPPPLPTDPVPSADTIAALAKAKAEAQNSAYAYKPSQPSSGKKTKKRVSLLGRIVNLIITLAVIALGVFLVLFATAKIAGFESIQALLNQLQSQLSIALSRMFN